MSDHYLSPTNNPLVSVIIPTYNRVDLLMETLQSLENQQYRNLECIIVDDGSTDNTGEKVKSFQSKHLLVKFFSQNNSGACAARNKGFEESSGSYIQYLDSDDMLEPDKIALQVKYLENNMDVDGVWGDWKKGDPDDFSLIKSYSSENLIEQFLSEHCIVNFSFLMRRSLIEKIGGWDINVKRNQEIDFHCMGLIKGANYQYLEGVTGLWRSHGDKRISQTRDVNRLNYFFKKWEKILTSEGKFSRQIKVFFSNFYFFLSTGDSVNSRYEKLNALKNAARLNPEIAFINTFKMKILRRLVGLNMAIRIWLNKAKK